MKKYLLPTWVCPSCSYRQDFDPNDSVKMGSVFPGIPIGVCGACALSQNPSKTCELIFMQQELDDKFKTVLTIPDDDEIHELKHISYGVDKQMLKRELTETEKQNLIGNWKVMREIYNDFLVES